MGVQDRFNDESKKSPRKPERRAGERNSPAQEPMPGTDPQQEGSRARGQRSRPDQQRPGGNPPAMSPDQRRRSAPKSDELEDTMEQKDLKNMKDMKDMKDPKDHLEH